MNRSFANPGRCIKPERPEPGGFTMVELIVVIMIVGITAAVVAPRMGLLQGFDEIGYRDQVRATLEYARKSAVAQRRNVRIDLAPTGVTVTVEAATPEGEGTPGTYVALSLPGSGSNSIAAPANVSLPGATTTLTFDALGRTADTSYVVGSTTITIVGESGHVY